MIGVLLYGPPAAGKDTVAASLHHDDERFALYPRVKSGPGRTTGYRMVDQNEVQQLRAMPGEVLWETQRYQAAYLVIRSELIELARTAIPVVALGQPDAIPAVSSGTREISWFVVSLWCPRETAAARVAARGTGDDAERMAIYDATPRLDRPHVFADTSISSAFDVSKLVRQQMGTPK